MPFRLLIADVNDKGADLSISGQLVDGSFAGPEAVVLCGQDGQWVHSTVAQHSVLLPKDWPVVPGDGSTLVLSIPKPKGGFKLNRQELVVGQGPITHNPNRIDISAALATPAFWAIWVPLHLECDELPEPGLAWGLSSEDVNDAYAELFQSYWDSGVWPYIRLALPGGRYIEVEYAAGVEFQTRVWVGFDHAPRVLVGYDSGHFSFPTMRIQEVLEVALRMDACPAAPTLLLAGAYLSRASLSLRKLLGLGSGTLRGLNLLIWRRSCMNSRRTWFRN